MRIVRTEDVSLQKRWKLVITIITILALTGLVYALRHQIFDTIANIGKVNSWALLGIVAWQAINYHATTSMYQSLFKQLGYNVTYKPMLRATTELTFINNVFPSGGVSGFSYFGLKMKTLNVSPGTATLVQMMRFGMLFVSFQILLLFGLFALALEGRANTVMILVAGSITTLLAVATLGIAFIIGSKQRINAFFTYIAKLLNRMIHVFRRRQPETINIIKARELFTELHESFVRLKSNYRQLLKPLVWALIANIAEVMTVYSVYIAFGHLVNPGAVILAYAIANFAGLVSVLPGGVGIYEALMTAVLAAAGVSPALSIPVTVMYRVLNMLLQLPPGYYFYYKTLHERPEHS